ncbi:hypothetical protein ACFQS1_40245 [Paractinoplanes rhizophilus]|jgi:hypothetical protein|uniref:Uncharacterized protein n=1 Tax=Paractinoplanes rhizophilus TaxID=1416877 RepID=A0ABW2I617_9ACTN|nr:hypothetical protein [Actinoplanes sp.]
MTTTETPCRTRLDSQVNGAAHGSTGAARETIMTSGRGYGTAHTAVIIESDDDLLTVLVPELLRSAGRYGEILLVVG